VKVWDVFSLPIEVSNARLEEQLRAVGVSALADLVLVGPEIGTARQEGDAWIVPITYRLMTKAQATGGTR